MVMKTKGMSVVVIRIILFILISLYSMVVFGQTTTDGGEQKPSHIFKVYPTISSYDHRLDFYTEKQQSVVVTWVDLAGRAMMQENLTLEKGVNSFSIRNNSRLAKGNYILSTVIDGKKYVGRLIVF